jgi:hypothetical protein
MFALSVERKLAGVLPLAARPILNPRMVKREGRVRRG